MFGGEGAAAMIRYSEFSALRVEELFPYAPEVLRDLEMFGGTPAHDSFDWEYYGGLWCQDSVEGVSLLFPEVEPDLVGAIELMPTNFGENTAANARAVLERLRLPIRFGDDAAAIRASADDQEVAEHRNEKARLSILSFTLGEIEPYHIRAIVCDDRGLVSLEVLRPDLVEENLLEEDLLEEGEAEADS